MSIAVGLNRKRFLAAARPSVERKERSRERGSLFGPSNCGGDTVKTRARPETRRSTSSRRDKAGCRRPALQTIKFGLSSGSAQYLHHRYALPLHGRSSSLSTPSCTRTSLSLLSRSSTSRLPDGETCSLRCTQDFYVS